MAQVARVEKRLNDVHGPDGAAIVARTPLGGSELAIDAKIQSIRGHGLMTPEEDARTSIDKLLAGAGWVVQDRDHANLDASRGVAIREFALGKGFGEADYLLFADGQAVGVIEAKKEGATLVGVEIQTQKYRAPRRRLDWVPCRFCWKRACARRK